MTLRPLPRARLGDLVPSLLHDQALVALVAATGERAWAGAAAWDVARAAAVEGRRVALVDLGIEDPSLHETVNLPQAEGIVDAFEYGVSLTKAARQVAGVFFIGTGSYTATTPELLAHPRWQRLHAGFRSEGALLLLYLSSEALGRLSAVPDGVLALAPRGLDPESAAGHALAAAVARGAAVIGVVREGWSEPEQPAAPIPPARARRAGSRRRTAALLLAVAAGGWLWYTRSSTPPHPSPATAHAAPHAAAAPLPPPRRIDTLSWTVQLAAYGTPEGALGHADALADDGVPALVAPVASTASGPVWYRVLAGNYPGRDSAAAARAHLWKRRAARDGEGDLLKAPYSLVVDGTLAPDSLRHLGIPAVRWADGRLLVGAFETPEQAAFAQAALTRAGVQATLLTRTDTTP